MRRSLGLAIALLLTASASAHAAGSSWRSVTFDRTVQAADRALLDAPGVSAVHPKGGRTYLAFVSEAGARRLAAAPHVAAVRGIPLRDKLDARVLRAGGLAQVVSAAAGTRATFTVRIDSLAAARGLALRPDVLLVTSAPTLIPEDEGTAQLLAGNLASGAPLPGYLQWLGTTGLDGSGVKIALVDTGADASHPDLDDRIVQEINYDPALPIADIDEQGHGTHVAGIIAGHPDDGADGALYVDGDGLHYGQGVAPGAQIVAMNGLGLSTTINQELDASTLKGLIPTLTRDAVRSGAVGWNASWHTGEGDRHRLRRDGARGRRRSCATPTPSDPDPSRSRWCSRRATPAPTRRRSPSPTRRRTSSPSRPPRASARPAAPTRSRRSRPVARARTGASSPPSPHPVSR